ncbi:MAG TPA: phage holin family protein [Solirubrobacteraceae bacterium]|nr:phage holin family protein [Solirubrobacteraceae bacterium]
MSERFHSPRDDELRDHSLGDLFGKLSNELSTLIRQELALARAELTEKGREAGKGAGLLGGAGIVGLLAAGALTAAIVAALDLAMATWLAALIVAVVYGAVAAVLALRGKARVKEATPPVPEQTVDTVKEDVAWAKTRARSGTR